MDFKKLFNEFKIDSVALIETIVNADIPSVIVFKDTESRIIYVNDKFFNKHSEFQSDPSSVYGKTDFDLFPESVEHAKQAFDDEQQVMKTGNPLNLIETEGKDDKGRTIIAHTRKYPLYNQNHDVFGTFVITEDLTTDVATLRENQQKTDLLTKLNRELTEENTTDTLSRLYNRRFIRAELDSLLKEYQQNGTPFSAMMLDLDNFKRINDEFGHPVGDDVIAYVGSVLLNIKRLKYPTIEPCRFGGDEFLVIMPNYEKQGAATIAKDIKEAFDNQILRSGKFHETVKMSIGIACIDECDNIHDLLSSCDKHLYEAKKNGKQQIQF